MTKTYADLMGEHRKARRVKLLRVAADVISERGIHNTTMDDVAEQAGVSKVVLYRYFGAKNKLVHAVLDEFVELVLEVDQEPADWWTERMTRTLKVAREVPSAMKLLVRHAAHDPEYGVHFEKLERALVARVEERQAEILGDTEAVIEGTLISETITAFLLDAYVRWTETGDPADDEAFLTWLTRSIRGIAYYWRGMNPPQD